MFKNCIKNSPEFDEERFLKNISEWSEELAKQIAVEIGISELTDKHWKVIRFLRKNFIKSRETPTIKRLIIEAEIDIRSFYKLFLNTPLKNAFRIAGLPKPRGCV